MPLHLAVVCRCFAIAVAIGSGALINVCHGIVVFVTTALQSAPRIWGRRSWKSCWDGVCDPAGRLILIALSGSIVSLVKIMGRS